MTTTFRVTWHTRPTPSTGIYSGEKTVIVNHSESDDEVEMAYEKAMREIKRDMFNLPVVIDKVEVTK